MSGTSLRLEVLGTESDRIGPFAILGLSPQRCAPAEVHEAHGTMLARLAALGRRDDPEAARLRLEIDAAAALLLDPRTRQELIEDYYLAQAMLPSPTARQQSRAAPEAAPDTPGAAPTPTDAGAALRPAAASAASSPTYELIAAKAAARSSANGGGRPDRSTHAYPPGFLRDLLAAWVSAGGWNGRARHRIIAAGAQHGVSDEELLDAILTLPVSIAIPRETPLVGLPGSRQAFMDTIGVLPMPDSLSPDPQREAHEAAKRNLFAALLAFFACAAVLIPVAAWVVIEITRPGPKPVELPVADVGPPPTPPVQTPALPTVPRGSLSVKVSPMSQTFAGLLEQLDRDSAQAAGLDEATLRLFNQAASQGRRQWMQFDSANRERLREVLVSCLYRLGDEPSGAALLVAALDPDDGRALTAETISGRAWSVGMLAVLMREPDLPAAARLAVEQRWRRHVPAGRPPGAAGFDDAAVFALREMIPALVRTIATDATSVQSWVAWLQCASSLGGAPQVETLALDAAGQALTDGPDLASSDSAGRVIAALFSAVRWSAAPAGRAAMLGWWDDPRVSISDLAVISAWLVSSGSVRGLDESFILPMSAGAQERSALRQRLLDAWKTSGATDSPTLTSRSEVADWAARAQRVLDEPIVSTTEELLAQTIRAAYEGTAAMLIWSGRGYETALFLPERDARVSAARLAEAPRPLATTPATTADGRWAVRLFRARKDNDREGMIRLVEGLASELPGDTGPIDAAVLADVAHNGQPRELRLAALNLIAQSYTQGPTVLLALADRMIPDRADALLSEAIERITGDDLPDPRHEQWYALARLALLRHAAGLRAVFASGAGVDALAELLGEVYAMRLTRSVGARIDPVDAARLVAQQWIETARPMLPLAPLPASLDQIIRRASIRAAVVDDPVGRFHAWQIASIEAACYVASAERPAARASLAALLERTTRELAAARSASEQLLIAERAMLRVWLLRFGIGVEGGSI